MGFYFGLMVLVVIVLIFFLSCSVHNDAISVQEFFETTITELCDPANKPTNQEEWDNFMGRFTAIIYFASTTERRYCAIDVVRVIQGYIIEKENE